MDPTDLLPAMPRLSGFVDAVLGTIGTLIIRVVLAAARLWARMTRARWHD